VVSNNKLALIGLAFKAGKTLAGTAACEKGMKQRRIKLMILQEGIALSSKKLFEGLCARNGIKSVVLKKEDRLDEAIGRPGIMVLGVTDRRFAEAIHNKLQGGSGIE